MSDEKPKNVIEALSAVMRDLPAIGKDERAAQAQGGYAYRGIEAITKHAQPLFAEYGVVFVPRVVGYEIRDVIVNGKPWTDTVEQIEYDVYGPGGTEDKIVVGPILAIGRDNTDKGGNKCLTQAYKYALIQVLCISDAKDDADHGSPEADAHPEPVADPVADGLRQQITDAITEGRITSSQAADAAAAHGVLNKGQLHSASAEVLSSIVDTLRLNEEPVPAGASNA